MEYQQTENLLPTHSKIARWRWLHKSNSEDLGLEINKQKYPKMMIYRNCFMYQSNYATADFSL